MTTANDSLGMGNRRRPVQSSLPSSLSTATSFISCFHEPRVPLKKELLELLSAETETETTVRLCSPTTAKREDGFAFWGDNGESQAEFLPVSSLVCRKHALPHSEEACPAVCI